MKLSKNTIYIILLLNILLANQILSEDSPRKIVKKNYSKLFKQARSLEKNALFNQAEIIYETILTEDPGNKVAFNKIKVILKNKNNLELLQEIAEAYQKNQENNAIADLDLMEIYIWSNNEKWEELAKQITAKNINNDFILKILLNKLLTYDKINYAKKIINSKREDVYEKSFYSYEIGNYYISRIDYENSIKEFLIYLDSNPQEYNKISTAIISLPDYVELQNNITIILQESSLQSSKMLLSDLAFKMEKFEKSYDLLKKTNPTPKQLLNFAYQNKKIKNYPLAIKIYNDIIYDNHNTNTTISAILNLGDTMEKQSIELKINLPISKYFFHNKILNPPYHYLDQRNLEYLEKAISLYDSLYSIKKGSEAGFRLAEIKFNILNDLNGASKIYNECIKYSSNQKIQFNSTLGNINIMIVNGELNEANEVIKNSMKKYTSKDQIHKLKNKELQINYFLGDSLLTNNISTLLLETTKENEFYNDLLDLQSLILTFRNNEKLSKEFSEVKLLIFQNKINLAINKLSNMLAYENNDLIINDLIILHLSYLLILQEDSNNALNFIDDISHQTVFSEFAYILKAEIFDFILIEKQNAANIYIDFLEKYPLSIYYDDIRLRLRELTN